MPKRILIEKLTEQLKQCVESITLPMQDAEKADMRYALDKYRLALQKQVEALAAIVTQIDAHFIDTLPISKSTGVSGQVAHIQIKPKVIPRVANWDKFYAHVKKTGQFDLMQRRLSAGAVEERWTAHIEVPGVEPFNTKIVSCTKVK